MIEVKMVNGGDDATVTFTMPADAKIGRMAVVGDFNDWDPTATPMRWRRDRYTATATVEARRRYSFRYLGEGSNWLWDEASDGFEPGPFGTDNCVLDLTRPR